MSEEKSEEKGYASASELEALRGEMRESFARVDKRFEQVDKKLDENYKLAQRTGVLLEKVESDVKQIAEGVLEVRGIARKLNNHEDRISNLEWRTDMHEKAIKEIR